jgi:hypothetical protein
LAYLVTEASRLWQGGSLGEKLLASKARQESVRQQGLLKGLARYALLGLTVYGLGYVSGYYLSLAKGLAASTAISIGGGVRATIMAGQDLAKSRLLRNMPGTRMFLAGKVGIFFGALAFGGAASGLFAFGKKFLKDTTGSGNLWNIGNFFSHGGLSGM